MSREQRAKALASPFKDPARLTPAAAFADLKGKLTLPAGRRRAAPLRRGRRLWRNGKGLSIAAGKNGAVSAPCDGWVVFGGLYRSYGQLLINHAGAGYYVVMAGMSRIHVNVWTFVLAGEPGGEHGRWRRTDGRDRRDRREAARSVCRISARTGASIDSARGGPGRTLGKSGKGRTFGRLADDSQDCFDRDRRGHRRRLRHSRQQARALLSPQALAASRHLQISEPFRRRVRQGAGRLCRKTRRQKLVENAINGMLTSLDPHSSYLDAKGFKDMRTQTEGKFGGARHRGHAGEGFVKVVSPIDDTPASRAGVLSGRPHRRHRRRKRQGMTLNQAVDKCAARSAPRSSSPCARQGPQQGRDRTDPAENHIKSVRSRKQDEDIGYVRISSSTRRPRKA